MVAPEGAQARLTRRTMLRGALAVSAGAALSTLPLPSTATTEAAGSNSFMDTQFQPLTYFQMLRAALRAGWDADELAPLVDGLFRHGSIDDVAWLLDEMDSPRFAFVFFDTCGLEFHWYERHPDADPKLTNRTGLISSSSLESPLTTEWSSAHQTLFDSWRPRLREFVVAQGPYGYGFTKVGYSLTQPPHRDAVDLATAGILADYFDRTPIGVIDRTVFSQLDSVELVMAYFNRRGVRFHWTIPGPDEPEGEGLVWSAGIGTEWLDSWWSGAHRMVLETWESRIADYAGQAMAGRGPGWHEVICQLPVPGGYVPPWKHV